MILFLLPPCGYDYDYNYDYDMCEIPYFWGIQGIQTLDNEKTTIKDEQLSVYQYISTL